MSIEILPFLKITFVIRVEKGSKSLLYKRFAYNITILFLVIKLIIDVRKRSLFL